MERDLHFPLAEDNALLFSETGIARTADGRTRTSTTKASRQACLDAVAGGVEPCFQSEVKHLQSAPHEDAVRKANRAALISRMSRTTAVFAPQPAQRVPLPDGWAQVLPARFHRRTPLQANDEHNHLRCHALPRSRQHRRQPSDPCPSFCCPIPREPRPTGGMVDPV